MPLSVVLLLKVQQEIDRSRFFGRAIHGYFLRSIGKLDPELASALHERAEKPFTVSPLFPRGPREAAHWLRFTSLSEELSALLRKLGPDDLGRLRLGPVELEVQAVLKERDEHPWAGSCSFDELYNNGLSRARKGQSIGLKFVTPTTFKLAGSQNLSMPLPWPRLVFQSLAGRWNSFSPIPLWVDWPEFERAVTVAWFRNLRSVTVDLGGMRLGGFTGECWFLIGPEAGLKLRQALFTLAEFSFYAGVGWKATMGMGMVRPAFED